MLDLIKYVVDQFAEEKSQVEYKVEETEEAHARPRATAVVLKNL